MIKRVLTLMLTLALLLSALPARGEDSAYDLIGDALYRIVLRTDTEDVTLGSGVLFAEQSILLTAEGCCAEGDLVAIGADGEHAILAWEKAGDAGAALMALATPSSAEPLLLANYDTALVPYIFGADEFGNVGNMPLYQVLYSMYRDQSALLLSGEEGLLPGAVVVDEKGQIVCLTVAQQTEGMGMYTALDPDGLYASIVSGSDAEAFLPLEVSWQEGLLTIAWEDEVREGGLYLITISGAENSYYTTFEAENTQRSIQTAVPPGATYYIQAQWAESADAALDPVWSTMTIYTVPEAAFSSYGFTQECCLVSAPAGQTVIGALPEMTFVSIDTLTDPAQALYLQITNRYDVEAEIEAPMTVELIAPDGQFYFDEMTYIFSPEYEQSDVFAVPVDELFLTCADFSGGALQPGEYALRYSIAGRVAGEYAFTVQPAGTPAPAAEEFPTVQETSGILIGVKAEYKDGFITVDWSGLAVPEGAGVTAYILYDGNEHFSYYRMEPGATTVDFYAVPGVVSLAWVSWSMDDSGEHLIPQWEEEFAIVTPPEGMLYTANGFTNVRCAVTLTANSDPEGDGVYLPEAAITRESLNDPGLKLVFQTEDTYQVEAESSGHALAFVLFTPEGYVFIEPGMYTFSPEWSASDLWVKDLTGLIDSYVSFTGDAAWPAGEYTVGYCIDGQTAAEITFTLE